MANAERAKRPKVYVTDGLRTILKEPMECPGCHAMHYWFIRTVEGHRCVACVARLFDQGGTKGVRG